MSTIWGAYHLPALQSFLPTLFVLSRYKNGSRRLCEESRKKGGGQVLSPPASI